ncbi:MAG: hypothetical protein SFW66_01785 [Gammaproteobacteria bacterium]|nr:hypothetical protein [Gammaproteobacteria bacterium]
MIAQIKKLPIRNISTTACVMTSLLGIPIGYLGFNMARYFKAIHEDRKDLELLKKQLASRLEASHALFNSETTSLNKVNMAKNLTHAEMVDWLDKYVNSPEFIASYSDRHSLELIAEATFWAVKLGLEPHLAEMNYAEIREFQPLAERWEKMTVRAIFIDDVCNKLTKPGMSHEASYALQQAAWCVYVHKNSLIKLQEEEKSYESTEAISRRSP